MYGSGHVVTFEECAVAYLKDGGEARFIMPMAEQLAGKRLRDITPSEVRTAARLAYPNAGNATLNRQGITPARAVINFGHQQGWCPLIRVKSFTIEKPKRRAVSRVYLDKLRPHIPPHLFALLLFLHTTGRRIGEAMRIEPEDVDLQRMRVRIGRTKNGDPAIAHLTAEVAELIASIMPERGPIFAYAGRSSIYPTMRRAAKKAKVEYIPTHQIGRHSYATTLADAGFSSKAIAEAGGWKSVRLVAETYEHPESAGEKAARVFGKKKARKVK